jgi:hypothetical protein
MIRSAAVLSLLLSFACGKGPDQVDASLFDTGADTGTATVTMDASQVDSSLQKDADPIDGDVLDGEVGDAEVGDGEVSDGDLADAEPIDSEPMDAGTDTGVDGGGNDAGDGGPIQLTEDFTDPVNEVFTCPDATQVLPGANVENGTQCLGIDGSGCPEARGLPGPGSIECSDPNHNPFIGTGQCVSDFFACFDPMGACSNDGAGTFTWANGARQFIEVDVNGRLVRSEFYSSSGLLPCVVSMPNVPGGTVVIYSRQ